MQNLTYSETIAMDNFRVKPIENIPNVPSNPKAKLIYYLSCVKNLINYDDNIHISQKYYALTESELNDLYETAKLLNPSLFINSRIIIVDPRLLYNNSNIQFYEKTDSNIYFHPNEEILIDGKIVKVLKVMACTEQWLTTYYYEPIIEVYNIIEKKKEKREKLEKGNQDNSGFNSYINTETSRISKNALKNLNTVKYGPDAISTICIYCGNPVVTETSQSCNYFACILCFVLTVYFCLFQICRGKTNIFCNVKHRCPRCGKFLGKYSAL